MIRLKIRGSHLTCNVAKKRLNVRERVEVARGIKMVPSFPLLACESSVSAKENPDRKNIYFQRKDGGCRQDRGYVKNLQWHGDVSHTNSQIVMRIHGTRGWW